MYKQERGAGFYLLVRPQNLWLEHGAKWAVVETGGTQSPADNLETGEQKGRWSFNNATKNSGYTRFMVEGEINVKCIDTE